VRSKYSALPEDGENRIGGDNPGLLIPRTAPICFVHKKKKIGEELKKVKKNLPVHLSAFDA